ncbi:hypothetical protein D3C76_944220 [compost metagenome]
MTLEAPHVFAGPAEAGLDLVGDENPASPLDRRDRAPQQTRRLRKDPVAGEQRIDDQRCRLDAMTLHIGYRRLDIAGEACAEIGTFGMVEARRRHQTHVGAEIDRHAERGRELRHRIGEAVIGRLGHDHARAAGAHLGDTVGDVVRLAAGAGQHQMRELGLGHGGEQALGQFEDGVVQIASVGRQRPHLPTDGLGHRRMAMPERGHVVVHVEVTAPLWIDQPHALATHDMQRVLVHQPIGRAEQGVAPLDHGRGCGAQVSTSRDIGIDHVEVSGALHWIVLCVLR